MTVSTKSVLKLFWVHAWKYKWTVVVIVVCLIASSIFALAMPWYLRSMINGINNGEPINTIYTALYLYLFFWFAESATHRLVSYASAYQQPRVMSDLQQYSFNYLIHHSYQFFSDSFAGSLVKKVGRICRSYERVADELTFRFGSTAIILVGSCVALAIRRPMMALILALWAAAFIAFNFFASRYKLKMDVVRYQIDSESTGRLADALTNSTTIKTFNGFENEKAGFAEIISRWQKIYLRGWMYNEKTWLVQSIFMFSIEAILLWYGLALWQKGILNVGDLILIQGYLTLIFTRCWDLGRGIRTVYESIAEAKELVELLELPHEIIDVHNAQKLKVSKGGIEFKKVGFNYHETRTIFKNLDLKIAPGEKVAFVGTSGAGKTTLTKLLFRFYDLTSGEILIDGQNIGKVTQESLRNNISLVPQEPILFHRTLRENILYGKPGSSEKEIIAAAKKAQCHDFIMSLPDKYETYVGERGVKLSGGERQRIAIARAILKNAQILVLDEATSSLDSQAEQLIQKALQELMKNKTTIVIAHRLSTIMLMDRIIVFEGGKVADTGTHDELLKKQGIYQKLWSIQAGGFLGE